MSLATRCTHCGTAFRVVQDQLKVSGGWVRCGRCSEVFSAIEGLFDLDRDASPDWQEPPAAAEPTPPATEAPFTMTSERTAVLGPLGLAGLPLPAAVDGATVGRATPDRPTVDAPVYDRPTLARPAANQPASSHAAPDRPRSLGPVADVRSLERALPDPERPSAEGFGAEPAPPEPAPVESIAVEPPSVEPSARAPDAAQAQEAWTSQTRELERPLAASADETKAAPVAARRKENEAPLFGRKRRAKKRAAPADLSERDRIDFSDARFNSDLMAEDEEAGSAAALRPTIVVPEDPGIHESLIPPGFVRRAESHARWSHPVVRAGLGVAAILLLTSLTLQVGHHFRDLASVQWPFLRAPLARWCAALDCRIEAPRRIDDISVESTALTRAPGGEAYQLAVALRSRSSIPVLTPWVDLSLTDASGKLIARKTLPAADFAPPTPVLQPGAEQMLQTLLATEGPAVSGFTVEIFYP